MKPMKSAPSDPVVTREDPLAGGADVSTGGAVSLGELGTSETELGVLLALGLLETGTDDMLGGGAAVVSGGDAGGTADVVAGGGAGAGVVGAGGRAVGGGLII